MLFPNKIWDARLKSVSHTLAGIRKDDYDRPWNEKVAASLNLARDTRQKDAWIRTACLEHAAYWSIYAGLWDPALVQDALQQPLVSPSLPVYLACHLADRPDLVKALTEKAIKINPHVRLAWQLRLNALRQLGREKEAEKWSEFLAAQPDSYTWDSCLCKDPLGGMP